MIGNLAPRSEQTENEAVQQTDLRTRRTPVRLAFADHLNRLIAGDRAPSSPEGAEMLTGVDPPLDGAVVLLEHVVQIWHWPMPAILGQIAFGFELRDGGRIRGVAVGVDDPRRGMVLLRPTLWRESALPRPRPAWLRGESRGSRRWNPPPDKGNATCLSPGRTSRPCASCHWWASGGGVSTAAIRARTAGPIATP